MNTIGYMWRIPRYDLRTGDLLYWDKPSEYGGLYQSEKEAVEHLAKDSRALEKAKKGGWKLTKVAYEMVPNIDVQLIQPILRSEGI